MRIYTSSWATPLPAGVVRIGISRGTPRNQVGFRRLPELAPGPWFNSVSPEEYHNRYMAQLEHLDPAAIVEKIERLAGGKDAALLCFEHPHDPDAWCHRGQVSAWLADAIGLDVTEYGMEELGCGWSHPKLHASIRQAAPIETSQQPPGRLGVVDLA